jgi:hypothetical protein
MGREESGGSNACRNSSEGRAPEGPYYAGGPQATCRRYEAAMGCEARGFGGEKDSTKEARHEESGLKSKNDREECPPARCGGEQTRLVTEAEHSDRSVFREETRPRRRSLGGCERVVENMTDLIWLTACNRRERNRVIKRNSFSLFGMVAGMALGPIATLGTLFLICCSYDSI